MYNLNILDLGPKVQHFHFHANSPGAGVSSYIRSLNIIYRDDSRNVYWVPILTCVDQFFVLSQLS